MPHRQIQLEAAPGLWPPTWPMGLTMLRLLLLPVFIWLLLKHVDDPAGHYRWVAFVVYGVMAATDKLDGYLARRLNQTSRLGAVLDPVADKLLVACSLILLSFDWIAPRHFRIPLWVVGTVYAKDVIIGLGCLAILSIVGKVTIIPRPLGKASTVLQLSMVMAVLIAPPEPSAWFDAWRRFVWGLWVCVTVSAALSCLDYVAQGVWQVKAGRRAAAQAGMRFQSDAVCQHTGNTRGTAGGPGDCPGGR